MLKILFLLFIPLNAHAYIGPGMGVGAIGVVFGVALSIVLALFAILWYPFKRLLKKMKRQAKEDSNHESS